MAGPTIDQAFIDAFNTDTHLDYQQTRAKLRGLVRTDANVRAQKVRFQKLGTITAGAKARNGQIPLSNPEHTYAEADMTDAYAAMLVDELDLTKVNTDVRGNYVRDMSYAFGRHTDDQIIDAMVAGATATAGDYSGQLSKIFVLDRVAEFDALNIDRDGQWFWAVTPRAWAHLMNVNEFVSADYNGPDLQFMKAQDARTWYGVNFFVHTRLPGVGTATAKSYLWHRSAVGHGINSEVDITWDWENLSKAWSVSGSMSMGACVIDANGLIECHIDDTLALS